MAMVITRREALVRLGALACTLPFVGRPTPAAAQTAWTAIGFSQGGLPLVIHHLGDGPRKVLILGGQHGGPEANTVDLVERLLAHFRAQPAGVPPGLSLHVLPVGNPDGLAIGSRQFLSGVDPNRNWAGADWQTDTYDSNGRFRTGLGGPEPFSEQETRALRDWVLAHRPVLVVNYHSAGGFLFGGRTGLGNELAEAYATASGYWRPQPNPSGGRSGSGVLGYRATGSMGIWQGEQGIPGLFIELTDSRSPEFDRNLAGLRAALGLLQSA